MTQRTHGEVGFRWNDGVGFDLANPVYSSDTKEPRPRIWWEKGWGITDLWKDVAKPAAKAVVSAYASPAAGQLFDKLDAAALKDGRAKLASSNGAVVTLVNTAPLAKLHQFFLDETRTMAAARGLDPTGWETDDAIRFVLAGTADKLWDKGRKAFAVGALVGLVCWKYGMQALVQGVVGKWSEEKQSYGRPEVVERVLADVRRLGAPYLAAHPERAASFAAPALETQVEAAKASVSGIAEWSTEAVRAATQLVQAARAGVPAAQGQLDSLVAAAGGGDAGAGRVVDLFARVNAILKGA
jgi:hypothetical protein